MISDAHSTELLSSPSQGLPVYQRWILGSALSFSLLSIGASGILLTQVRALENKLQDVATAVSSGQEHAILKSQVTNLNKDLQTQAQTIQAQTIRVTELNQELSNTKKNPSLLGQDIKPLNTNINTVKQATQATVRIGVSEPQDIGHGFWVKNLRAIPNNSGTRLVGDLVNATAVKYTDVIFNVQIGNKPAKVLSIGTIAGGSHVFFGLDFPEVPVEQAVQAQIDYVSATMVMQTAE